MRALDRLTTYNIKTRIDEIKKSVKAVDDPRLEELLSMIPQITSEGYAKMLTPNGIVRKKELDRLLLLDSDIVTHLGIVGLENSKTRDVVDTLKELVEERRKLVDSLRA